MKKNAILGVLAGALLLLTAGGAALAANQIQCPNRDGGLCVGTGHADEMTGTRRADEMRGLRGNDTLKADLGNDTLRGGGGDDNLDAGSCYRDVVRAGRGDDRISVGEGCYSIPPGSQVDGPDEVSCGPGRDVVRGVGGRDVIADDCERVLEDGS
ncbi:MAG: hypothetical protein AVDCRST_MAG03-2547 [uncultured Rubrobacteraceae bacterium]|uniref:Alkaline phosphatase n=1 Tax=uncultured Rubrobacteraceae bacterium TaxID=349277 RepID=A0A6J4PN14_9ACTN|nr:MAG: hypothetical protein AVDCRST_MAG03-2547 [uncultured Rubrobacteraceae bacterium]